MEEDELARAFDIQSNKIGLDGIFEPYSEFPLMDEYLRILDFFSVYVRNSQKWVSKKTLPSDIYFNFCSSRSINGAAWRHNDTYCVGINIGTWMVMKFVFDLMLSHPDIFPEIGNSSKETIPPKLKYAEIHNVDTFQTVKPDSEHPTPKDETRKEFSRLLQGIALKHIILHELGHIYLGHVDYASHIGQEALQEVDIQAPRGLSNFERQAFEIDADNYSIDCLTHEIKEISKSINFLDDASKILYSDRNQAIFYYYVVIYTRIRLFADEAIPTDEALASSHPPFISREWVLRQGIYNAFDYEKGSISIELTEIIIRALKTVEDIFGLISEGGHDASTLILGQEHAEHYNSILSEISNVTSKANPYSYINSYNYQVTNERHAPEIMHLDLMPQVEPKIDLTTGKQQLIVKHDPFNRIQKINISPEWEVVKSTQIFRKVARNLPCPCGSGLKYKNCCINKR